MKIFRLAVLLILLNSFLISAQEAVLDVPDRFSKIVLGMSMENVKKELLAEIGRASCRERV